MVGGGESDYSVCPHLLLQFFQFMSVRLRQVMPGYIRLHQVTSVFVGGTGRGARQKDRDKLREGEGKKVCGGGTGCGLGWGGVLGR